MSERRTDYTHEDALRDVCRHFCAKDAHDDACVVLRAALATPPGQVTEEQRRIQDSINPMIRRLREALDDSLRDGGDGMSERRSEVQVDGVRVGTLWKRNAGREVVRVERAWLYGHPVAEPTVRAHPTHGGRPLVAPTAWLREHYTEVTTPA